MTGTMLAKYWGLGLAAAVFGGLYGGVLVGLAGDWLRDDNYSHGFLVLPAAIYLAWDRREVLRALDLAPSGVGALIVAASLGVLMVGTAGIELFLTRISMIGVIAGAVVFLAGWRYIRVLAFPIAFLLLMIPLPAIIFNQIAFPLQMLATRLGVGALPQMDIPVLREGNIIVLASTTLEVAEACSGIRSLVSLITLALLYGYFSEPRLWHRMVIGVSAIPIAIIANGLRVAATGAATHYYGPAAVSGFAHDIAGWLVFIFSMAMIVALARLLQAFPSTFIAPQSRWQATRV